MEKLGCVIGILVFLFVTALVLFTDIGTVEHTVSFSGQNVAINQQKETSLTSGDTSIKGTSSSITNKKISSSNINIGMELKELNSGTNYNSADVKFNNKGSFSGSGYKNGTVYYNSPGGGVKSSDINKLKAGLKPVNNSSSRPLNYNSAVPSVNQYRPDVNNDDYKLKNIDWNVWRSNFVNRITDDTFYIPELDKYPNGTMFHYSFTVDSTGRVYNVKVSSLTISRSDREKIAELIRGYSYKEVTRFPAGSKRKSTRVSAILIFAGETEYSSPSDFHDLEQLRMKL